jgi:hypothetical protein
VLKGSSWTDSVDDIAIQGSKWHAKDNDPEMLKIELPLFQFFTAERSFRLFSRYDKTSNMRYFGKAVWPDF